MSAFDHSGSTATCTSRGRAPSDRPDYADGTITEYTAGLTEATTARHHLRPDGNVWFVESGATATVGRLSIAPASERRRATRSADARRGCQQQWSKRAATSYTSNTVSARNTAPARTASAGEAATPADVSSTLAELAPGTLITPGHCHKRSGTTYGPDTTFTTESEASTEGEGTTKTARALNRLPPRRDDDNNERHATARRRA